MHTGSAASAVTTSAPGVLPGVAAAGLVAANDALSPFSSLMDTLFQGATSDSGVAAAQTPAASAPPDPAQIANGALDVTAGQTAPPPRATPVAAVQTQLAASQAPPSVAFALSADATQADPASITVGGANASAVAPAALAPQASTSDTAASISTDTAAAPARSIASSFIVAPRPTSAPASPPDRRIGAIVNALAGSTGDTGAQLPALSAATGPAPGIKSDTSEAASSTTELHSTKAAPTAADADPSPAVTVSSIMAPPVLSAVPPVQVPAPAVQNNPTPSASSAGAAGATDWAPTPARAPDAAPLTAMSADDGSAPPAPTSSTAVTASAVQPTASRPAPSSPSSASPTPADSASLSTPSSATSAAAPNPAPVQSAQAAAQTDAAPAQVSAATSSAVQQPSAVAQFTGRARSASSAPTPVKGGSSVDRTQIASSTGRTGANASAPPVDPRADVEQAAGSGGQTDDPATSGQDGSSTGQAIADAGAPVGTPILQAPAQATAQTPSTVDPTPARTPSDTVANLSAQIAQKAGGQTTRFDVQLDPVGLGRVNVSVEIDAKGAMSAALSFEKSESASLLKSHSAELQQSLAQAGFDLSNAALSFITVDAHGRGAGGQTAFLGADGGAGQQGGQGQSGQAQNAGRAFGAASLAADQADHTITSSRGLTARGLDIRI